MELTVTVMAGDGYNGYGCDDTCGKTGKCNTGKCSGNKTCTWVDPWNPDDDKCYCRDPL
ncbi:MAG: hypothetical protein LBQ22_02385 [Bacteroidales bacterium]|nr:hypothetical protein [Bacteroidales bacterium]